MKMKKLVIKTLLSAVLVSLVVAGPTLAYLFATSPAIVNTFALARVDTKIEEPDSGTAADKDPVVHNKPDMSQVYVRATVAVVCSDASLVTASDITPIYNIENWEYCAEDGYWYYRGILQAGSSTPPLFVDVDVDEGVPKEAEFSVDVYHESILAPAGSSYTLEAARAAFAKN